jgi:hypothetical protein
VVSLFCVKVGSVQNTREFGSLMKLWSWTVLMQGRCDLKTLDVIFIILKSIIIRWIVTLSYGWVFGWSIY